MLEVKAIPQWLGSRVGLGLEQPVTYYGGGNGGFQNIMMSCWAPGLLRVNEHTGRDISPAWGPWAEKSAAREGGEKVGCRARTLRVA